MKLSVLLALLLSLIFCDALRASERSALEVKQSQEMLTASQARLAATATMVAMAEESLRITQNRYSAGLATITLETAAEKKLTTKIAAKLLTFRAANEKYWVTKRGRLKC